MAQSAMEGASLEFGHARDSWPTQAESEGSCPPQGRRCGFFNSFSIPTGSAFAMRSRRGSSLPVGTLNKAQRGPAQPQHSRAGNVEEATGSGREVIAVSIGFGCKAQSRPYGIGPGIQRVLGSRLLHVQLGDAVGCTASFRVLLMAKR